MSDPTALITLRTGETVPRILVRATFISLQKLFTDDPVAFLELVAVCQDRHHVVFGSRGRSWGTGIGS